MKEYKSKTVVTFVTNSKEELERKMDPRILFLHTRLHSHTESKINNDIIIIIVIACF